MEYIISSLLLGTFIGWFVRKNHNVKNITQKSQLVLIWVLLFLLGALLGLNKTVTGSLKSIGITALLLCISATLGSVIAAYLLNKYIFKYE